jgi:hypothetical protein
MGVVWLWGVWGCRTVQQCVCMLCVSGLCCCRLVLSSSGLADAVYLMDKLGALGSGQVALAVVASGFRPQDWV